MNIVGIQKTTLLDFPGIMATTLFTPKCNMLCPFCHNGNLVLSNDLNIINEKELFHFLKNRKNVLDGVCITGGEPTLQNDLLKFMSKLKNLEYKVKLDTNGLRPDVIKEALNENLVDYIAMDIKNSLEKYEVTCGVSIDLNKIKSSVSLLMTSNIEYEFRTTIIKEYHSKEDLISIGTWLNGANKYFLQQYEQKDTQIINHSYSSYTRDELLRFKNLLLPFFNFIDIRGV